MLNTDLAKPEVDLAVFEYTDIPMLVSLLTYTYKLNPWSNDSRYLYSHENMQKEIEELNVLMKSRVPWYSVFFISSFSYLVMVLCTIGLFIFYNTQNNIPVSFIFACTFIIAFVHYIMCKIYSYIITKSVIETVEIHIKELNKKYKEEQIYFKLINFSGLGFKYLKFLSRNKGVVYFSLRVVYKYYTII
ncbi:conserved Plasmodium protein, unknown function [Plasmodium malariae]|uniref:Uncharacterized protein n=1 Tax=Plasmodium malariae TaxID=5858 RepID=A0A1C3KYN1_PLAMA|nr:conserved Plasmodium protein, unknown function [Plasmodium malariae]